MFLVENLMLNLNQFKDFIYHERKQKYQAFIHLAHEKKCQKSKKKKKSLERESTNNKKVDTTMGWGGCFKASFFPDFKKKIFAQK